MKKIFISLLLLSTMLLCSAQNSKPALSVDDIVKWNRITESAISGDGSFIAVKLEPWKGATILNLYNSKGELIHSADSSASLKFTPDSKYLIYEKSSGKNKTLNIFSLKDGNIATETKVRNYTLDDNWDGIIMVNYADTTTKLISPDLKTDISLGKSTLVKTAQKAQVILTSYNNILMRYDHNSRKMDTLTLADKKIDRISLSENGSKAAFVSQNRLYLAQHNNIEEIPAEKISDKRDPQFSADGSKLYYHIKKYDRIRDTTIAKEDFPKVEVWHWQEEVQFTQQVYNKRRELDATWLAVYHTESKESRTLTSPEFDATILQIDKGNSDLYIASWDKKYRLESMWEGRSRNDIYLIRPHSNNPEMIMEGLNASVRLSPASKYLYWYSGQDSSWFCYPVQVEGGEATKITNPASILVFDENNDVPDWPSSYSLAGWSKDDKYILLYDKYDLWQVDPTGKERAVRLTLNGREKGITYRYLNLSDDPDSRGIIDMKQTQYLTGFDNKTKGSAIFKTEFNKAQSPTLLYGGNFAINNIKKAATTNKVIFTQESFEEFPDIRLTDLKFNNIKKITNANPQQKDFNWGTAELISWISADGIALEGVIYKPENFDPSKKYPMIVNFYETNSSGLYNHRVPEAHRSTIDYHMYTSNGYIVFNPDIVYRTGYPGESAFNAIMPGISHILSFGYVDPECIGAQGHSWGGYQVAYLATRTGLFAAIESGAPVVNMYSAYGGIRWGSGLNRSFQYEHQQSRIGATPWEQPLRYIENSPIFTMDKVTTPILIMHNDQDGHVPWYQGIEYFTSLKRLQKPVWLLNYTGEVHWPQKLNNKIDFQKRMMQFFNHYLKGEAMPKWMDQGVTAIDLDYETGY